MIFCNEMSPRVEEQFCKNICFLGIDTNYCSDLYTVHVFDSTQSSDSCFGYFRNHGTFLGLQAPCHFVRHSPSFMAAILSSISFWIWWRHQFFSQQVLCRPRFFCKLRVWLRSRLSHIFILYIFFRVQLSCVFWYSCDNTNARHHDRSSGRQ